MSQASSDDFLIDLFREEVRTNCQVIADGLVALEQGNASPQRLEAMMRAAHSIKGASRVVNVQPGVEISHAMEDCFVKAQKAELTLASTVVDVLLAGVDILQGIAAAAGAGFAAWFENHQPEIALLLQHLDSVVRENKQQASAGPAMADVQTTPKDSAQAPVQQESAVSPAAPPTTPETFPQAAAPIVSKKSPESSTEEGVVRVTARSLTRLMSLAGESLVEARWLQPFSKSLLQLKHLQAQLADTVESLAEMDRSEASEDRIAALRNDAREQLAACRDLLSDRMSEFDVRNRNTDDLSSRLYREVISSRMRPFRDGVQGLPRLVRDLARQMGKKAQLEIQGETTEVDRDILERLDAPLNHLVRNAMDHGFEKPEERLAVGKSEIGRLTIEAAHHAGLLSITVSDDGRGIDHERLRVKIVERGLAGNDVAGRLSETELLDFLFLPGFSTAAQVTEISGRGVGLDVVHSTVQSVGGRVHVHSKPGQGTSFQIELPVTLSVLRAVVVDIAGEPYAFPHNRIDRIIRVPCAELCSLENRQYFEVDGQNVGILMARQLFQLEGPKPAGEDLLVVLFGNRSAKYGLVVDGLQGEQDLVVRPVDRRLGKVPNLNAVALLDDGSPVLIVDPDDLCRSIEKLLQGSRLHRAGAQTGRPDDRRRKSILVVDDSITVREVERQLLANQGYQVEVAVDGMEGWNLVREGRFDLVISDIDMPRLNGLDLVRKIKADARLNAIPVVIVSYKDRDEDRLSGLEAGANHYLTKSSFHDDTLIQTVRELIGSPEE
ncbi:MAG: hybrid sensor histidine kinase/response regulator [Thermoguttaceae bacterium]|jgi:two-component system sensor histidine kinase and response regulator WspE